MKIIKPNLGILLAILFVFSFAFHMDAQTGKTKKRETRKERKERKELEKEEDDDDDEEDSLSTSTSKKTTLTLPTPESPDSSLTSSLGAGEKKTPGTVNRYPLRPEVLIKLARKKGSGSDTLEFEKARYDSIAVYLQDTLKLFDNSAKEPFVIENYGITYLDWSKRKPERVISPKEDGIIQDVRYERGKLIVEVRFNDPIQPSATAIFYAVKGVDEFNTTAMLFKLYRVVYEPDSTAKNGKAPYVEYGGTTWYVLAPLHPENLYLSTAFKDGEGIRRTVYAKGYQRPGSANKKVSAPISTEPPKGYGKWDPNAKN